jgi:hypothetical protein
MHSGAQIASVSFGDARHQVRGSSQRQRCRETAHGRGNVTRQSEWFEGVIDGALIRTSPRDKDVPCGGVTGGSDFALGQRVRLAHDANEAVSKQRLRTRFRTGRLAYHAGFQVNGSIAERPTVLVKLRKKSQSNAGSLFADASQKFGPEVFHKAFARPQRERSPEFSKVELIGGAQSGFGVVYQLTDALAKLERPG